MESALAAVLTTLVASSIAHAHPLVEEGRERLREAEFEAALEALARAEDRDDLTREDLVDLLDARAMAHLALDDSAALRVDLAALASLDPGHRFGREAPPELQEAFQQTLQVTEGPLSLAVEARPVPGGVEIEAEVTEDRASLVRETRVFARVLGSEQFRRLTDRRQPARAGQPVEYYVEAIGPGGAIVATAGSGEAPEVSEGALPLEGPAPVRREDGGEGVSPWVFVIIGAVLVVAGGVTLAIVLASNSGPAGTRPEQPIVIGF